jgi:hypothetical protein
MCSGSSTSVRPQRASKTLLVTAPTLAQLGPGGLVWPTQFIMMLIVATVGHSCRSTMVKYVAEPRNSACTDGLRL